MKLSFLFSLFLLLMQQTAFAVKLNTLYQAEVGVNSQSSIERNQAIQHALVDVLIKVSGNSEIINNPKIKSRIHAAETLVQEYEYITSHTPNTHSLLLKVHFDVNGINQWLRDGNLPLWGQNRPHVLSWIIFETAEKSLDLIGNDSINPLVPLLKQNAEKRGVPILFPILDVTDLRLVNTNDIMTFSSGPLMNAAKRYGNGVMLIGRIIHTPPNFTGQWKFIMGNDQWEWRTNGNTLEDIASLIINRVTDTLASRYAVITTNTIQKDVALKITGINQQNDFTQLIRYLNHLTPVAEVAILRITGNHVLLSVSLRSTEQSFIQAIALGQQLTPVNNNPNTSPLIYQWNN